MIVKVRDYPRLRELAKAYKYRKHEIILSNYDSVELSGGYWDGGSRSAYSLYTPPATIRAIATATAPPQFRHDGIPERKAFAIPRGSYVVEGGTFRGKPAHLHIFGIDAEHYFAGSDSAPLPSTGYPDRCGICLNPLNYDGWIDNRHRFHCVGCGENFNLKSKGES